MGIIGILTEKKTAGENFAKALGGYSGVYNGERFVIVSASGHLYEYAAPSEQVKPLLSAQYKSWDLQYLPWDEKEFLWKRVPKPGSDKILTRIKEILDRCSEVSIATDSDPSGEGNLLAWEIIDELNIRPQRFTRMYFDDESVSEIQKAFINRKVLPSMEEDMDFVKARYRSRWDMLSMQFTRIATNCAKNQAVIRQGRLKSVMVSITGDELKAIKEYKRIPVYLNKFKDENGVIYTSKEEPTFPQKSQVPQIYKESSVVKDKSEIKHTAPPKLIDLAALASRLSKVGVNPDTLLSTYQKMYENHIVSYPRTEDTTITEEQFNMLLPKIDAIAALIGVDASLLTHRSPRHTHIKSGIAHGANRPGKIVPKSMESLKNEYGECAPMIYEALSRSYLAMLAEDYEFESQTGHIKDYPEFIGSSNVPLKQGWKLIFTEDASDEEESETSCKGLGAYAKPYIAEKVNPRPPTPTMTWLMKKLEKHDVGTGATRVSIFNEIVRDKKYPLLKMNAKGKLEMPVYGQMSYILLENTYIGDVKLTENLMKEMRDIELKNAEPFEKLHQMQAYVKHDMEIMLQNAPKLESFFIHIKCPLCGKPMRKLNWGYACSGYKKDDPTSCKFSVGYNIIGAVLTDNDIKTLVENKRTNRIIKGFKNKKNETFNAYLTLPCKFLLQAL